MLTHKQSKKMGSAQTTAKFGTARKKITANDAAAVTANEGLTLRKNGRKFKSAGTGRVVKSSPVAPKLGIKRIRAAVASVLESRN